MTAVAGIVLCGGHSRRMGRPKAWLPFGDEFLLQRVVRTVGEAVGRVIVVAAKDQSLPPLPDFATRIDDRVSDRGPLAGLAAGLAAGDGEFEVAYLPACDVPFLTTAFIRHIIHSLNDPYQLAAVPFADVFHPLAAAYRTSIRPVVERRLAEGQLRLQDLFAGIPHRKLSREEFADIDPDLRSLVNVNTEEDWAAAIHDSRSSIVSND